MSPVATVLIAIGSAIALLAGVGVLRFETAFARFHAAGKASPVAFVVVALGGAIETGWSGAAQLAVAGAAMVLTLPVAVHLLFRAVHRSSGGEKLRRDDLAFADAASANADPSPSAVDPVTGDDPTTNDQGA